MAHTILLSRGNINYRLKTKAMQDGEVFLEDKTVHGTGQTAVKNSRIHIWAQLGNPMDPSNPGAIDITDWIVRLIKTHENTWKTSGHTPTETNEVHFDDQQQLAMTLPSDGKKRPHGATPHPQADRIAAYDAQGRLSSEHPANPAHVVRKDTLDNAVASITYIINTEVTKLKKWISWIIGETDADGNYIPIDERNPENSAILAFDQISEIVKSLNNDPNVFMTLNNTITNVRITLEQQIAAAGDNSAEHRTAPELDHPNNSVTDAKLADTLNLTGKIVTVATPALL